MNRSLSGNFNIGDKVVFAHSRDDKDRAEFSVVDVQDGFIKVIPGAYGQPDMIVEQDRLVRA